MFDNDNSFLRFWGVRGSIPTPGPATVHYGGNTSCVELRVDGQIIILDAGTGIRELGLSLEREFEDRPIDLSVLITHTHWDHIQGFPFFSPAYNPKNSIRVMAVEGARKHLENSLFIQMESAYFPVSLQEMPSSITIDELEEKHFMIGPVKVEAIFTYHPGVCVCYKVTSSAGTIVYVPDNELVRSDVPRTETSILLRKQNRDLREFIRGADIVIMDSQYDCDEYPRFIGWGHSCFEDSVSMAAGVGVKQFFLFHHDPSHDDQKVGEMVEESRALVKRLGSNLKIDAAREGVEVRFKSRVGVL